MKNFFKKDVNVRCMSLGELGRLLDWIRGNYGFSALNMNRFAVTAVIGSQLGQFPSEVLYFEVRVPYHMYATLRDKYLKEKAIDEVILQQEILKQITGP